MRLLWFTQKVNVSTATTEIMPKYFLNNQYQINEFHQEREKKEQTFKL